MTRCPVVFVLALAIVYCTHARAEDLADLCHASSSYDLDVAPDALVFERAAPAPRRVRIHAGALSLDGAAVRLNTEDRDRLVLFEEGVRALLPNVRSIATDGVDVASNAVRAEAQTLHLSRDTLAQLEHALATRGAELKRRIATSNSTRDWQGDAFDRYGDLIGADIAPLVAADLTQQAIAAAVDGDLAAAQDLQHRAADLASDMQPRLARRMQALAPKIRALCPSIKRLAELQQGVRGANARPLDLLETGTH